MPHVKTALLSVYDKTGLIPFAHRLAAQSIRLISTGGTAQILREAGIEVEEVEDITGFPEMMEGRVKTLHPHIHGGILARRDREAHIKAAAEHNISMIDMVVLNLYPFADMIKAGEESATCIEMIDIGGPAMLRAAAKNHAFVTIVTDPRDYEDIAHEIESQKSISGQKRKTLACKAFHLTAQYDALIATWLGRQDEHGDEGEAHAAMPDILSIHVPKTASLRYGENPHQSAATYLRDKTMPSILSARQIQGKALSYNNINDGDVAFRLVGQFDEPAVVIVKHANPCGVAMGEDLVMAWQGALSTDPISAFGGIVACNRKLDEAVAKQLSKQFIEVIIAPDATEEALRVLGEKPNLRVLLTGQMPAQQTPYLHVKSILGGYLVQSSDIAQITASDLKLVTHKKPNAQHIKDMLMAWKIAQYVKSNAIIYVKEGVCAGIGAGQMSRVDSCRLATQKAIEAAKYHGWDTPRTQGGVLASDAFFPFADGVQEAIKGGVQAIIQPGGSKRDDEVIQAANEAGIAMVFTGIRHFNH